MTKHRLERLSTDERRILLSLARKAIEAEAAGQPAPRVELDGLPETLQVPGACFVTLHKHGELRGCTGTLVSQGPLAQEVARVAAQTALRDYRFLPVMPEEVPDLDIEVSILTPPQKLDFSSPRDLPKLIRPGVDGVTLNKGIYRATFLPQVWERVSSPKQFLDMLCQKMGLPSKAWTLPGMTVETYQVEEFSEKSLDEV